MRTQQVFTPAKFTIEVESPEELRALAMMANTMTTKAGHDLARDSWSNPDVMTDALRNVLGTMGADLYEVVEAEMIRRRRLEQM